MQAGRQTIGHPVDVATGTVYSTHRDYTIPGQVELIWERRYSTALLNSPASPLGPGWTTRYFATLTRLAGEYRFVTPDGDEETFSDPGGEVERGGIVRNLGSFQELKKSNGRYVVVRWNVESGGVERNVFLEGKAGDVWPLESIEDVTGQALDMLRDKAGRLLGVRQRLERRTLALEYNAAGQVQQVYFAPGDADRLILARFEYDRDGRLTTAIDARGSADRYEYDSAGRMTRELVKDGGVFSFRYDERGRCVKTWGIDRYDEKTLRFRDAVGWTEVTDSKGATTRYQWLPTGQVVQAIGPLGATHGTEYDEDGRIVAKLDPNGASTKYGYDEKGNRSSTVDVTGGETKLTFNDSRLPLTLCDAAGGVWRRRYDATNRLIEAVDPAGGNWSLAYDADGNATSVTSPLGARMRLVYGEAGTLREATDWEGQRRRFKFDALGRIVERIGPLGESLTIRYDPMGNAVEFHLPDGSRTLCAYDQGGRPKSIKNEDGRTTEFRYGPCGRLLQRTDQLGNSIHYEYGTEPGQLTRIINENGEAYTYEYNEAGLLIRERGFDGVCHEFAYDLGGRCVARIRGDERLDFVRDAAGRLIRLTLPDGTASTFAYDEQGKLQRAANAECEALFEYDALSNLTRETQNEFVVESGFDAVGNLTSTTSSLGHHALYSVNGNGALGRLTIDGRHTLEFARNPRGQETTRKIGERVSFDQTYDAAGRLISQHLGFRPRMLGEASALNGTILEREYRYDRSSAVLEEIGGPGGDAKYVYDPAGRLLSAVRKLEAPEAYEYDQAGNIVKATIGSDARAFEYGVGGRLNQAGAARYEYDQFGRVIKKTEADGAEAKVWSYAWSALDQLVAVQTPDGLTWNYQYDALGRRILKECGETRIRYVWDRNTILHELDERGAQCTWVFEPYTFSPLCQIQEGECFAVLPDQLGTPQALVDEHGDVVWVTQRTSWGVAKEKRHRGIHCPLGFQGQWADEESGLCYNRFRYYDPSLGRYISPDPIRMAGGLNLYSYARNPINWTDPFGLVDCDGGEKTEEPEKKLVTVYHYTDKPMVNPDTRGAWNHTAVTNLPGLSSQAASQMLGIPPPKYCYPITIDPSVTPLRPGQGTPTATPPFTQVMPSNRYMGGGPEAFLPKGAPPGSIGPPTAVK